MALEVSEYNFSLSMVEAIIGHSVLVDVGNEDYDDSSIYIEIVKNIIQGGDSVDDDSDIVITHKRDISYMLEYLPFFIMSAGSNCFQDCSFLLSSFASKLLSDNYFISTRMQILGLHESIRLQIADLRALYAAVEVLAKSGLNPKNQSNFDPQDKSDQQDATKRKYSISSDYMSQALRATKSEMYHSFAESGSQHSLYYSQYSAVFLLCIGMTLAMETYYRNSVEAIYNFEEAIGIFRLISEDKASPSLFDTDLARSLSLCAEMYINIGQERLALIKYEESLRIYKSSSRNSDDLRNWDYLDALMKSLELSKKFGCPEETLSKFICAVKALSLAYGEASIQTGKRNFYFSACI